MTAMFWPWQGFIFDLEKNVAYFPILLRPKLQVQLVQERFYLTFTYHMSS